MNADIENTRQNLEPKAGTRRRRKSPKGGLSPRLPMESDYDEVKRKPMAGKIMYLHDHASTSQYSVGLEDGRQSHRESSA